MNGSPARKRRSSRPNTDIDDGAFGARHAPCYQAGDPVEVWYDPEKPVRATLKPGGAG